MILPIVAYGDPVLRKVGVEIDKDYPQLDVLNCQHERNHA